MKLVVFSIVGLMTLPAWGVLTDPGDLDPKDFGALYACIAGCGMGQQIRSVCEKGCWKLFGARDDGRAKVAQLCPKKVGRVLGECLFNAGRNLDVKVQSAELRDDGAGSAR